MTKPISRRQTRGAIRKTDSTFVAAWIPDEIVNALDKAVQIQDTDRSKLIRKALRTFLSKS